MDVKWSNIPIPEAHLAGIAGAIVLHFAFPLRILNRSWMGHLSGWVFINLGIVLAGWAVIETGAVNVASPTKLIATGPYALSRNPMYVAWTAIGLGTALVVNTMWLVFVLPVVVLFTP